MHGGIDLNDYHPTILAKLLHDFPHINVSLHRVNGTFNPQSEVYLESLGILASIPASWLILTLSILLIYLTTRCCDSRASRRKQRSLILPRLTLTLAALLCAGATGLGLYANDDLHNGLVQMLTAARHLNAILTNIRNQTIIISNALHNTISTQLTDLTDIFDSPVANQTALFMLTEMLNAVKANNTNACRATEYIQSPLNNFDFRRLIEKGDRWELYRWAGAMGILSCLLALCAILLVGAARQSRHCLVFSSVLALISASTAWLLASIGLSIAVAMGDFCVAPEPYLAHVMARRGVPADVLHYYLHCDIVGANPFTQRLRESQQAVTKMRLGLTSVSKISLDLFKTKNSELQPRLSALTTQINSVDKNLASLAPLLDCRGVYAQWLVGVRSLCMSSLLGLVLIVISIAVAGFLLSILVCLASHIWIYLKKRRDYSQVEETDPFLPGQTGGHGAATTSATRGGMGTASTLPRGMHHHRSQGSYNNNTKPTTIDTPLLFDENRSTSILDPPPSYSTLMHADKSPTKKVAGGSRDGAGIVNGAPTLSRTQSRTKSSPLLVHGGGATLIAGVYAPTAPAPFQFFDIDGCDAASSRHHIASDLHHRYSNHANGGGGGNFSHLGRGHSTLGRLPSHSAQHHSQHHDHYSLHGGPNNGKYATLSKQCKTLEANDFY